ncbi:MAG: adenylate/guanylate cyclase domain-containing protein [Betaproteobacteria bacterium]|nr:MAG: adenylate/guanylate cyclase domain-containing protein [Betaproteobacteria bacterium]
MSQKRKLAAILSADVVGYSRLMAADEAATVQTIKSYRDIITRLVVRHDGRVVDAPGDALLAEFPSAVEAVRAAVDVQKSLEGRNIELDEERRMQFRIGVNLGDVIEESDGSLYGDGLNIAARLEALADAGGICISSTVFDAVEGKLSFGFDYLGDQQVKNIPRPIRVYRVRAEHGLAPVSTPSKQRVRWKAIASALVLVLLLGGGGAWYYRNLGVPTPETVPGGSVLELPKGPSIAVLPFVNLSGDPEQEYFSDGLTEDIITELARARELHVLARNTTFQFKGQAVDIQAVGRKLGVQYVLEGSVRRSEDQLRITAQLIDVTSGVHLWAERYDRKINDVFALQDEITSRIVGSIATGSGGVMVASARSRAVRKPPESLEAYELVLRATASYPNSQKWYDDTTALLERAIRIDPNYARARQEYAWHKLLGWIFRFEKNGLPSDQIKENAIKAIQLDPNDALAHRTAAYGFFFEREFDLFEREAQLAFELAPYNADVFTQLGAAFLFSGQWDRGRSLVKKAYELNPASAGGWYYAAMHYDHYRKGEYLLALEDARAHPGQSLCETQWKYVAAHGQLGEPQKAKQHWDKCVAAVPNFSADWVAKMLRIWNFQESFIQQYMEGIRKAGFPCRTYKCGLVN